MFFEFLSILPATCFCCFLGGKRSFDVLLGRNCSQGKLKLIYLMMLLQTAMIIKSLPKYMYMYCPTLSSINLSPNLNALEFNHLARTKECTAVSRDTRINDCLDSPVSLIPSGLYTNTSHT